MMKKVMFISLAFRLISLALGVYNSVLWNTKIGGRWRDGREIERFDGSLYL
jgi:hypothetical protein